MDLNLMTQPFHLWG